MYSIVNNVNIVIIASSVSSVQYCKTELCKTNKNCFLKKKKLNSIIIIFVSFIQNISKAIASYTLHRVSSKHIFLECKHIFSSTSRYYSKVVDILQMAVSFLQLFPKFCYC